VHLPGPHADGHGFDVGHAGGTDGASGHGGHAAGEDVAGSGRVSPLNMTAMMAFVAWFGGIGYLALNGWQLAVWLSLLLALAAGLVGWAVVFWFYSRVLLRSEGRMDPAEYRLEGTVARVTAPISAERIGEVQFARAGALRSESARSADASTIAPGTEVVIVRYERGMAYVQPWEAYVENQAPEGRQGGN
jgi:membrane protein implicated in regulation of membrane protease activity